MKRSIFYAFCLCAALLFPAALFAQGGATPKVTHIPGGIFVEWDFPVEIAAVQFNRRLTGSFEIMFDVPSVEFITEVLDRRTPTTTTDPGIVTALADYWMVRGKPERAIPLYEGALNHPNIEEGRALIFQNNLAMLYSRTLGQHDKALEVIDNALNKNVDNPNLLNTKGLILLNSGDPAAAIVPLDRAVELSCQLPLYCMHLAYAFHQTGQNGRARQWFDQVRAQLNDAAPNMGKENREMFDSLQGAFPF